MVNVNNGILVLKKKRFFGCHTPQDIQEGKIDIFQAKKMNTENHLVSFYLIHHQIISKKIVLVDT